VFGESMADEFRIEEHTLEEAIKLVSEDGELQHRMLYHILSSLMEMGHRWRSAFKIVLLQEEGNEILEGEYDEDYANYLDLKSQREKITWEEYKESIGEEE
jgi:hypothetical protein